MGELRRWRLDLAYDGTDFHGWASQPGLRTVPGTLEHWITMVLRLDAPAELTVAGRTDAGVHAQAQVAHVDLPADLDASTLVHRLGRVLPGDLVVHQVSPAPEGFDARFSAIWRRYRYQLWDASSRPDPLLRHQVSQVGEALDLGAMQLAAASLVGLRDFAPFCKYREGATTIRELLDFEVDRRPDEAGTIECRLLADAFCHSMVRSLVGALWLVGSGRRDLAWLAAAADHPARHGDIRVMPPGGLCLVEVGYPADDELADRAVAARARRELPKVEEQA